LLLPFVKLKIHDITTHCFRIDMLQRKHKCYAKSGC
jgi:hypothetical protein